jgi:predicted anti-sigma-YlaC factor YlaD
MTVDPRNMTCQQFQSQLPEIVGSGQDVSTHPHLQSCDLCRALVADLETIAEAARQLLPIADPPDTLWTQIESAIQKEKSAADPA